MTTATPEAATASRTISYREAINEALKEEMRRDERVFAAGIDLAERGDVFGITAGILREFGPRRILDTPISENAIAGLATGSAAQGLRPVVSMMFIDFIGVCFDQIMNQMAKMKYMFGGKATLPLTVLANAGAGGGMAAQHSQSLEALLCHIPGIKVVMPTTPADAKGLMTAAMRDDNPVFVIMHKRCQRLRGEVPEGEHIVPIGSAAVVREGRDLTIVATAYMVQEALAAADRLAEQGIEAEIVDPRQRAAARHRHDRRLGREDASPADRPRGRRVRRHRGGDQRPGGGPGVRLPRRPAAPSRGPVQPRPLQPTAGTGVADQRRRHRQHRARRRERLATCAVPLDGDSSPQHAFRSAGV